MRFRTLAALILTLSLLACDDEAPEGPAQTAPVDAAVVADAAGSGGQGGAGGAQLEDADVPAPPPTYYAACDDAPDLEAAYAPAGCAHTVTHPRGVSQARASCGAADSAPTAVHVTFPTEDPSTTVAIQWTTADTTQLAQVQLGSAPDALDQVVHGHSFTYTGLGDRRIHEVHLCGLTPGRTYWYRVGGEGHFSPVHRFTTAPAVGSDDEIVFGVAGDTRSEVLNVLWTGAVQAMADHGIDAMLFSGDLVDIGLIQAQWDEWFQAGGETFASIPFIPANGNHDLLALNYLAQFALPRNEENFHYRYGDALVISLNDFPLGDREAIEGRTRTYLAETLEANRDAKWKFVVHHRAMYSASNHGSMENLRAAWAPLYDEYEVDAVFNGHDHNYERSHPIRGEEVAQDGKGTYYVIAAGIGAPLYGSGEGWWTAVSESVSSYGILRIAGDRATFTGYRLDGTVIDEFVMEKAP